MNKAVAATLTITASPAGEMIRCESRLELGSDTLEFTAELRSPFDIEDLEDARWYFEEFPRLTGTAVAVRAAAIEGRLRLKGTELWVGVFGESPEARQALTFFAELDFLRALTIRIHTPEPMTWIPWEWMVGPELTPMCQSVGAFVRVPSGDTPVKPPVDGLRILVVTARPRAAVDEEDAPFRSISRQIVLAAAVTPSAGIDVELLRPPTLDALKATLQEAKDQGRPFDLVHFDGHGEFRPSPFSSRRKRGYLLFEREDGKGADPVHGSALGAILAEGGVRVAVFNACRSAYAEVDNGTVLDSLADEVARCGIEGVVAMAFNVSVATAANLTTTIYSRLAAGWTLGCAVGEARRVLTDRPGVRELTWPGILESALPVVYEVGPVRLAPPAAVVQLRADLCRATPNAAGVVELPCATPERSGTRPFVGYDDLIFEIERALLRRVPVEVVGLAGSGKSALVAEFARWSVLTGLGEQRAVIVDLPEFASVDALQSTLPPSPATLWILEAADQVPWGAELAGLIGEHINRGGRVLLTGRARPNVPGSTTVIVPGLDHEDRRTLATHTNPDLHNAPGMPAFLEWSQGLPGLLTQEWITPGTLDSVSDTQKALEQLRGGTHDDTALAGIYSNLRLQAFDPAEVTGVGMPIALHAFQAFVSLLDWKTFTSILLQKGFDLGISNAPRLLAELRLAIQRGLACPINDEWVQLHPLAPQLTSDPFYGVIRAMARHEEKLYMAGVNLIWSSYLMAASAGVRMAAMLPGQVQTTRRQQNRWRVVGVGSEGGPAALVSLPLLASLRDDLLAAGRDEEWDYVLAGYLAAAESNPAPEDHGPDSPYLALMRLLDAEAVRNGDTEASLSIRDRLVNWAREREVTISLPERDETIDVSRNQLIATLIRRGEALAKNGSGECVTVLMEADELARDDAYRKSIVELALARAYYRVPSIRDLAKYEEYARKALASALPVDPEHLVQVRHSLGNAIAVRLEQDPDTPEFEQRFREAWGLLSYVATSKDANTSLRAAATNSRGLLNSVAKRYGAAAADYLQAGSLFEAAGSPHEKDKTYTNAVRALHLAGKLEEARLLASVTLEDLEAEDADLVPVLLEILRKPQG